MKLEKQKVRSSGTLQGHVEDSNFSLSAITVFEVKVVSEEAMWLNYIVSKEHRDGLHEPFEKAGNWEATTVLQGTHHLQVWHDTQTFLLNINWTLGLSLGRENPI